MPGRDAFGTQLCKASAPTVPIANVVSLDGPSRSKDTLDLTAHNSPNQYREFLGGLKDGGEVSMTLNYDPDQATHAALDTDFESEVLIAYILRILPDDPDEHEWSFSGIITDLSDAFPHDDKMEREVTIKISGKPVLAATGS